MIQTLKNWTWKFLVLVVVVILFAYSTTKSAGGVLMVSSLMFLALAILFCWFVNRTNKEKKIGNADKVAKPDAGPNTTTRVEDTKVVEVKPTRFYTQSVWASIWDVTRSVCLIAIVLTIGWLLFFKLPGNMVKEMVEVDKRSREAAKDQVRLLVPGAKYESFYPRGRPLWKWYCLKYHAFRIIRMDGSVWYSPWSNQDGWIHSDSVDWDRFARIVPKTLELQIGVPSTRMKNGRQIICEPVEVKFVILDPYHN